MSGWGAAPLAGSGGGECGARLSPDRSPRQRWAALSDRALAEIVADRAVAAGLEGDFAGHSLRSGFATAAARSAGRSEAAIMRHGRWKSVQIARRYIRQGARWDDNPAANLGHS